MPNLANDELVIYVISHFLRWVLYTTLTVPVKVPVIIWPQIDIKEADHEEADHEEADHEEIDHEEADHEEADHEEADHEEDDNWYYTRPEDWVGGNDDPPSPIEEVDENFQTGHDTLESVWNTIDHIVLDTRALLSESRDWLFRDFVVDHLELLVRMTCSALLNELVNLEDTIPVYLDATTHASVRPLLVSHRVEILVVYDEFCGYWDNLRSGDLPHDGIFPRHLYMYVGQTTLDRMKELTSTMWETFLPFMCHVRRAGVNDFPEPHFEFEPYPPGPDDQLDGDDDEG